MFRIGPQKPASLIQKILFIPSKNSEICSTSLGGTQEAGTHFPGLPESLKPWNNLWSDPDTRRPTQEKNSQTTSPINHTQARLGIGSHERLIDLLATSL